MSGGRAYAGRAGPWEDWRLDAACFTADSSLTSTMYPTHAEGDDVDRAKAVCAGCPVRDECLEFAMATNQDHGVWGGLSEQDRRRLRRSRRRRAAS